MSRREFIKIGAAAAIGVGVASAIEIPILESNYNPRLLSLKGKFEFAKSKRWIFDFKSD